MSASDCGRTPTIGTERERERRESRKSGKRKRDKRQRDNSWLSTKIHNAMNSIQKSDDDDDGDRSACSWRHAASPRVDSVANSASVMGGSEDEEEDEEEEEEEEEVDRLADEEDGTSGANCVPAANSCAASGDAPGRKNLL